MAFTECGKNLDISNPGAQPVKKSQLMYHLSGEAVKARYNGVQLCTRALSEVTENLTIERSCRGN